MESTNGMGMELFDGINGMEVWAGNKSNSIFSFHSTNQIKKCYFFDLMVDEEKMN